jgi:membrane fusion protein
MSFFRPEVLESKKNSMWGTVLIKPNKFYERAFQAMGVTTLLFLILIFFGRYYTKETVQGIIEPNQGLVSLYAPQTGYIEHVYFHQGDLVHPQDKILTITTKQRLDEGMDYDQVLRQQLQEDEKRLFIRGQQLKRDLELKKIEHEIFVEQARINLTALEQQLPLQEKMVQTSTFQFDRMKQIHEKGSIPQVQLDRAENELNAAIKDLINMNNNIHQLRSKIENEQLAARQLQQDYDEKNLAWEQQVAELAKKLIEINRSTVNVVHAPFSGRITQLNFKKGQFVRAGQHVGDLQKEDDYFVSKLFVSSRSIGLIKVGQRVSMRVHAFPYEHYGTLLGRIEYISDSLYQGSEQQSEPIYVVYVKLDQQAMKPDGRFPLKQGLVLDADIKTQEMTIIQKILEPIYRLR